MGIHDTLLITTLFVNISMTALIFANKILIVYIEYKMYIKSSLYMDNMHRLVTVDFA